MELLPSDTDPVPGVPVSIKSLARVLAKLAPINYIEYGCNGITFQLLPFFKFLRVLGQCPFSFETVKDREGFRRINYNFEVRFDLTFILSGFVAVFITSCSILGLLHAQAEFSLFGELWPFSPHLTTIGKAIKSGYGTGIFLELFEVVYILVIVFEYIIIWLTSPALATWMNGWNSVEDEMKNCPVILEKSENLSKFWKFFVIPYMAFPTIVLGTAIAQIEWNNQYPLGLIIIITYSYISTASLLAQDLKVIVMFKAIELNFKKVRQAIHSRYNKIRSSHINYDIFEKPEIRNWQRILIKIRKQAGLAGSYMAVHQLFSIATCIFFASSALFTSSNLISEQSGSVSVRIPLVLIFTTVSFARVILKVSMAVRVTREEKRVATLLKDLELIEEKEECQSAVKNIYEMLTLSPTEISLGDYVHLNNSLILGVRSLLELIFPPSRICGQVLTQFIVYQQFQNSKRQ